MRNASKLLILICVCTGSLSLIPASIQADTLNYEIRIASGTDDAEEQNSNGNMSLTSSDLELINDFYDHGGDQTIGLRFNTIPVDPGAIIQNASIRFTVDEAVNTNPCNLTIQAQAVDSALPFTGTAYDITSRSKTSAATVWSPVDWTAVGSSGADQATPNIAAIIQEVIDRPGWVRNNSIVILITGSGKRVAKSYEGGAAQAALLTLQVTASALSVNITSPTNGSIFNAGSDVTINADASTPEGTVTKVEFFENGEYLGEDLSSPYSFIWNAVPEGTYLLTAQATDSEGLSNTSASVTINMVKHPPAVSLTSPANDASFNIGDAVTITADADDTDGTVTKVEFFQGTAKLGEDLTAPYSYIWNSVPAGTYSLTAKAIDNDALSTTSEEITISVVDHPPAISLTSPANGSVFDAGSDMTIQATAGDTDGTVTKVEFYEGAVKLGEDLSSPYSFTWNAVGTGNYVLTAKATDNGNNTNTSLPVSVMVFNMISLKELAVMASYWGQSGCGLCGGVDYSGDNDVDVEDLAVVAEYWLMPPPLLPGPFRVVINECMAANGSTAMDPQNDYDDWIEIYNHSDTTVDLSGMYLTDKMDIPTQWQFPSETYIGADGYLLVWADEDTADNPNGLHANFKLSAGGDQIALFDTDGVTLIDSIAFGNQTEDVSYGRYTDGTDAWYFMGTPTPGAANMIPMSEAVYFSHLGGPVTSSFVLKLSTQSNIGQIRYTTNGDEPTTASMLYNEENGISIGTAASSRIRARSYQPPLAPGPVSTQAYLAISSAIQSYNSNLPIVVVDTFGAPIIKDRITKPWAYGYSAFFAPGSDGRTRLTSTPDHVGKCAIKHRGNSSYGMGGYRFEIQDQFGNDEDVALLGLPEESDWVLHRLHYDDSYMRDPLAFEWSSQAGLYAPRTQYFVLFLNTGTGQISSNQGLYALTERIKVGPDRVDIPNLKPTDTYADITGGYIVKKDIVGPGDVSVGGYILHDPDGQAVTAAQLSWLQNWFNTSGMPINKKSFMIYYYMVQLFKPVDVFNASTFYNIDGHGKWNMGPVWDFNLSTGGLASPGPTGWAWVPNTISMGDIEVIDGWFALRETAFDTAKIMADIDARKVYIAEAATANVSTLKAWLSTRLTWIDDNIGTKPPVILINETPMNLGGSISSGDSLTFSEYSGTVYYTTDGTDPRFGGTAYSQAVPLTQSVQIKARSLNGSSWSALNEAIFCVGPVAASLRITEIMYHPANPDDEFIELKNIGASPINLALCTFTDGIEFTFPDWTLAAGDYALVAGNQVEFTAHYPWAAGKVVGQYSGYALSNGGEEIVLRDAAGTKIHDFDYSDWYPVTDGHNFSLCILSPANADLTLWDQKDGWQASRDSGGSPGSDNPANGVANGAIVINEVLTHTDLGDGDWIELRNMTGAPIDIGGWFLSDTIDDLKKYQIAAGTSIPANGYIVFTQSANFGTSSSDPGKLTGFGFSELGEEVFLSSGWGGNLGGGFSMTENFAAADKEVTFGRYVKSSGGVDFVSMAGATRQAANSAPLAPSVVINEIIYHSSGEDETAEYIELYNRSGSTAALYDPAYPANTWKFTEGVLYTFPTGVIMAPSEYILIVRTDPDIFRYIHGIPASIDIYGPYDGALDNDGDKLELSMPGAAEPDGHVPYIRLEQIHYSDGRHPLANDPWPIAADGGGSSLVRKVPSDYGNDAANWQANTPTPGQ